MLNAILWWDNLTDDIKLIYSNSIGIDSYVSISNDDIKLLYDIYNNNNDTMNEIVNYYVNNPNKLKELFDTLSDNKLTYITILEIKNNVKL